MTKTYRELTGKEKRQIKKLVVSKCANYDKEYGCLPLDCECYMFGVCYSCSRLCSCFRKAVLPEDKELQAVFEPMPSARNAASTFKRMVNEPTVPTSAPQKQDASKRQQECVSTENKSANKTLCNELTSEMP